MEGEDATLTPTLAVQVKHQLETLRMRKNTHTQHTRHSVNLHTHNSVVQCNSLGIFSVKSFHEKLGMYSRAGDPFSREQSCKHI